MPFRYPPEFPRKVLDLVAAGRSVALIAADLRVSDQTVYIWRRQELIDTGVEPGLSSVEVAGLESELAVARRANELLKEQVISPKGGSRQSR
jgi:transposase-like protein